jgi:hypothetical protein
MQMHTKLSTLILCCIAMLLISVDAFARDYTVAGETNDAGILVDRDQLKSMKQMYPIVVIKWIKHWKSPRDYGLKDKVLSEGFDSWADCRQRDALLTTAHRFHAPDLSQLKNIEFTDFSDKDNFLKGARRDEAPVGSAAAIALDYACSWAEANR